MAAAAVGAPAPIGALDESATTSANWSVLPTELRASQGARIARVALLYAAVYSLAWGSFYAYVVYFHEELLASPLMQLVSREQLSEGIGRYPLDLIVPPIAIGLALALWAYVRKRGETAHLCGLSMALQVDGAFCIAIAEHWRIVFQPEGLVTGGVSWVAFWVLMYPLLVPTVPKRALVGSLLAATMGPIATWLATLGTSYQPTAAQLVFLHFPNYVAVGIAYFASRYLFALGRTASKARRLGAYELVDRIGRGGMGEVWKATHALLKRPAAVKLIRPERLGGSSYEDANTMLRRFEREAQATALLSSPHTVTLYDYGTSDDGTFYYVMELLDGFDLETLVERFGPQESSRVASILFQMATSLADAHEHGLIHRDVKPANVFVSRQGIELDFVKVLDFGLVKSTNNEGITDATKLTIEGIASGTPAYMAPEIGLGEHDVDGKVDVYAMGCVAYWLLTGHVLFDATSPMKMVMRHIQDPPVPPSQLSELPIDPDLEALVMSCLAKSPADRPSARGVAMALCTSGYHTTWGPPQAYAWWSRYAPDFVAGR